MVISIMALRNQTHLKTISRVMLILNLASVIFGVFYVLFPAYTPAWDVFGGILLATIFGNLALVFLIDRVIDKKSPSGRKLNLVSYGFLVIISVMVLGMMGINFISSSTSLLHIIVLVCYFGLLGSGMLYSNASLRYCSEAKQVPAIEGATQGVGMGRRRLGRLLRILVIIDCWVFLLIGFLFCIVTLAGADLFPPFSELSMFMGFIGVFTSMWDLGWAIIMLAVSLFLAKMMHSSKHTKLTWGIGILGLVMTGIMVTPSIATLASTSDADATFTQAFGPDWQTRVSSASAFFLPTRFVLPGYFLGAPPNNCVKIPDVSFYNGTSGKDTGIELKFDAYLPPNNGQGLLGGNSTLIRIHGGAWVIGDKGFSNIPQMNEYFAAQGYCVFDIQYGLNNASSAGFFSNLQMIAPPAALGNFTIEDMLRHVGYFCKYLCDNQAKYGANLSSVFVSGGSAGGQLTCATALAIASRNYTSGIFSGSNSLIIKGIIPFYPANGMGGFLGYTPPELDNPALLVNASSAPCLIFQGNQDGLINPSIAKAFKKAYADSGNIACALIMLPFAGHGNDMHFAGYYNQFFLYYMERFMYLYR
jgi:acetyl esterase/lipase